MDVEPNHGSVATPRLDRIRPRVLRAFHVRGWVPQFGQSDGTFTVFARLTNEQTRDLRATLRFAESGVVTMEGAGGPQAVADLRAEMRFDPALASALEGVL